MYSKDKKTIFFAITPDMSDKLDSIAKNIKISRNKLLYYIVLEYLEKFEKKG